MKRDGEVRRREDIRDGDGMKSMGRGNVEERTRDGRERGREREEEDDPRRMDHMSSHRERRDDDSRSISEMEMERVLLVREREAVRGEIERQSSLSSSRGEPLGRQGRIDDRRSGRGSGGHHHRRGGDREADSIFRNLEERIQRRKEGKGGV